MKRATCQSVTQAVSDLPVIHARIFSIGVMLAVSVFIPARSQAVSLYWDGGTTNIVSNGDGVSQGGNGTWNTTTNNWDQGAGQPHVAWNNANSDTAFFAGTAGTVTLAESITLGNITFASTGNYTISGSTLNFVAGGSITNATTVGAGVTITSGITGSPAVGITCEAFNSYAIAITFAPTNATQTLGTCTVPYWRTGFADKCTLTLGGTTTGNSITKIQKEKDFAQVIKNDSGTWSVGNVDVGQVNINAGSWIETGTINGVYQGVRLSGGVLHYNNAGAVGTINTAGGGYLFITGGSIDNSSGAAITTSTYNPPQTWGGNWTFIGSGGANSDINIGTGKVTLVTTPTITVSNATTTLTINGVITDGTALYGLTKAGAGTLKLTGKNTYKGSTTVNAGTLVITQACLSASAGVYVASGGAKLNLDFTGTNTVLAVFLDGSLTAAGTYGATGSGAANIDDTHFSGTGVLSHNGGMVATNTWHWDGPNYGGTGDGLSAGGNGIWSATTNNWDQGIVSRKVWPNTTNDMAFFNTVAGTVTLGSSITLGSLDIRGVDYTIGGASETNTLNFGGTNTITVYGQNATFNAGISGKPTVNFDGGLKTLRLQPASNVNMDLGTINVTKIQGGNSYVYLDGASAGNSVSNMTWVNAGQWLHIYKQGSGTWTVNGAINAGGSPVIIPGISAGTLIISTNGSMYMTQQVTTLNGGALHLNNAGAYRGVTIGISSGSLDNSSGAAITTSTYNPAQSWNGNFTFLGSQGTNSDLYLGNGAVALTVSPVVTINSNATLTVGGVVSGAFGLTKSGTGALKLSGNNTYSGVTSVTNGTLAVVTGGSCSNSAVSVASAGTLLVSVTNSTKQWVCASLTNSAGSTLKFVFAGTPGTTTAPLKLTGALTFTGTPSVTVDASNLLSSQSYPLLKVGDGTTPPSAPSSVTLTSGLKATLAWGVSPLDEKTLYLKLKPAGTLVRFF